MFEESPQSLEDEMAVYGDRLKYADSDYKFAQVFTHAGGIFSYCENEKNALYILKEIIRQENIQSMFCWDEDLMNFLNVLKVVHTNQVCTNHQAAFITCEYLIAHDGKIVLTHNNIQHYQIKELPETIIVMANMAQIVPSLTDAMMNVKRRGGLTNLTSVSGKKSKIDTGIIDNSKLFLILLED